MLFGWATEEELDTIHAMALKVNDVLSRFLDERGVILVDFKLEFGRHHGKILLGDEICPDTCRFWDKTTLAETRQGPLPPRPRRRRGGLPRDAPPGVELNGRRSGNFPAPHAWRR